MAILVHGWDYRRYVVSKKVPPLQSEIQFTSTKINENFSNYSAWHYRSRLIGKIGDEKEAKDIISKGFTWLWDNILKEDFKTVQSAYFTEPADQSAWLYNRWLLGEGTHLETSQQNSHREDPVTYNVESMVVTNVLADEGILADNKKFPLEVLLDWKYLLGTNADYKVERFHGTLNDDGVAVLAGESVVNMEPAEHAVMRQPPEVWDQELQSVRDLVELEPESTR
ncbi:hypothetical protein HK101_007629 [Irineochytrium annulatum]|nr:hypothetical protein HK101_007629 [Irineochytrium annulatum]